MEDKNKQRQKIMKDKNKKRDPMPPPDATPEEIGEFWDTHSLADYWDETHEVEFQVNLKSRQNLSPDEAEGVEKGWQKLKKLVQSVKPADFERLVAALLTSFLKVPFVVARSGDQPRGDARSLAGEVSIQVKRYTGKKTPDVKTIEGDIGQARRDPELHLQTYILAVSRDTEQLSYELNAIARETGLDIVTLELLMSYQIWGHYVLLTGRISAISLTCQTLIQNFQIGFK